MRANPIDELIPPAFPASRDAPLELAISRGNAVESLHRVHALVMDSRGQVVSSWGDLTRPVFPRSTIKALQALPLLLDGYAERWNLGSEHLALACASHYGEDFHVQTVAEWLERIGLGESALECGAHEPFSEAASKKLAHGGQGPCRLHNNCSGKHTGMLTGCVSLGLSPRGYSDFGHPYQEKLRKLLSGIFGLELGQQPWGIDGCGIPTYAMPLESLARGIALCAGGEGAGAEVQTAMGALNSAIREKPEFMEGTESICTRITRATQGSVIAKSGAEGVFAAWAPEKGLAFVLKVEDGAERAAEAGLCQVLAASGFSLGALMKETGTVYRWGGEPVGKIYFR